MVAPAIQNLHPKVGSLSISILPSMKNVSIFARPFEFSFPLPSVVNHSGLDFFWRTVGCVAKVVNCYWYCVLVSIVNFVVFLDSKLPWVPLI